MSGFQWFTAIVLCFVASDHLLTMRALRKQRRSSEPSGPDRIIAGLYLKLVDTERFIPRDDGMKITSSMNCRIKGQAFVAHLERAKADE